MMPVGFREANMIYAKDQKEYLPLPAYQPPDSKRGEVVSCWRLSLKERIVLLFSGCLWLSVWTFKNPLQPIQLTVIKGDVIPSTERKVVSS